MGTRYCGVGSCWVRLRPGVQSDNSSIQGVGSIYETASLYPHPHADVYVSYIQMSGMIMGGMIEADHRLRQYEEQIKLQQKMMRQREKWQRYGEEFASHPKEGS